MNKMISSSTACCLGRCLGHVTVTSLSFPHQLELPCLAIVIPPLLEPKPNLENDVDTLIKTAILSEERNSKFLALLIVTVTAY